MRARLDAEQTAAQLTALGHEAILAPVFDIVATSGAAPAGPFDATVATSAHALATSQVTSQAPRHQPFFAVGNRTAAAAAAAGFTDLRRCDSDAAALATVVAATLTRSARLLYLAGRDRKPMLEAALIGAGLSLTVHEAYEALGAVVWPEAVIEALKAGHVDAALHFSRRSATLALDLARRHDVLPAFRRLRHYCLSQDVCVPLCRDGAERIDIAPRPDAESLLALVNMTPGPLP